MNNMQRACRWSILNAGVVGICGMKIIHTSVPKGYSVRPVGVCLAFSVYCIYLSYIQEKIIEGLYTWNYYENC